MSDLAHRIASLSPEKRALLETRRARGASTLTVARRADSGPCPTSFSQQRLWLLDQMEPGDPAYNVFRGVILRGRLDAAALQRALEEIVRRHQVLRTTFPVVDGLPIQKINGVSVPLPLRDLASLPLEDGRREAHRFAEVEAERPFDLSADPLLRAHLLRLAPEEHVLALTMHHIAVDGFSVGIFFRELAALYGAFSRSAPSPLPEPYLQFGDYAAWERNYLDSGRMAKLLDYWKHQLSGMPRVLILPADRARPPVQTSHGARHYFRIPNVPLDQLKALGRQHNATLYMAVLAAFQVLLSKYAQQEEFGVGSPMACREVEDIKELIGCFSNTLVLRACLSGSPSFRELLQRVRETVLSGLSNQMMPFDKLVEALNPKRDASRVALVQVNFRLLSTVLPVGAGDLTFDYLELDNRRCKFDLAFELVEGPRGLGGYVEYSTDLFLPESIARMMEDYEDLLRAVVAEPDLPVSLPGLRLRFGENRLNRQLGIVKRKPAYLPAGEFSTHRGESNEAT